MGFLDKLLKRNKEGITVPQYFNDTVDDYEVQKGKDGAAFVSLSGRNVEDTGSRKGFETIYASRVGSVAGSTPSTLFVEVTGESFLENLDLSFNSVSNPYVDIYTRKADGTYDKFTYISQEGSAQVGSLWFSVVRDYKPSFFKLDIDDSTNNRYKASLVKRLYFANGLKIEFRNTNASAYNLGISAIISKMAQ
jgi:hypothetical protein